MRPSTTFTWYRPRRIKQGTRLTLQVSLLAKAQRELAPSSCGRPKAFGSPRGLRASLLDLERDHLFLETLRDLDHRSSTVGTPEYEVLRSAVLLRQLLLDSSRLVDQVNRDRRVPLRFRANVRDPVWKIAGTEPPAFWSVQDGLDPETALTAVSVADLDLEEFLARVVMMVDGTDLTVTDMIRQTSHVLGGVHAGDPKAQAEQAMADVSRAFRIGGYDPVIRSLQAVWANRRSST